MLRGFMVHILPSALRPALPPHTGGQLFGCPPSTVERYGFESQRMAVTVRRNSSISLSGNTGRRWPAGCQRRQPQLPPDGALSGRPQKTALRQVLVYDTSRLARDDNVWFGGWPRTVGRARITINMAANGLLGPPASCKSRYPRDQRVPKARQRSAIARALSRALRPVAGGFSRGTR
jgi:hypothetical protein